MANLGNKDGIYLVRFRYEGKEYKKSLKTRNATAAETALHDVASTILKLGSGRLSIPAGHDPGDFIASGGELAAPAIPAAASVAGLSYDEDNHRALSRGRAQIISSPINRLRHRPARLE
jgi:hypothetical protein